MQVGPTQGGDQTHYEYLTSKLASNLVHVWIETKGLSMFTVVLYVLVQQEEMVTVITTYFFCVIYY